MAITTRAGKGSALTHAELDENFNFLNAKFGNLILHGIYDYNDLATATTPIAITQAAGWVNVTNDGAGAFTNKTYALPGIADVWDTGTNAFDFTNLSLGDTIEIRLDLEVTTSGPNQNVKCDIFVADGTGGEYQLPFVDSSYKITGTQKLTRWNSLYMGDTNTLNNPARFKISSDGDCDLKVNGWYAKVSPRTPMISV